MSGFQAEGAGDGARPLYLRDSSKADTGEADELGWLGATVFSVIEDVDPATGLLTSRGSSQAFLQPRNLHYSISKKTLLDPGLPHFDRRISVALIADHEHDYPGFALNDASTPSSKASPFFNDWDFEQKSTRLVDYRDSRGRTATLGQLIKITDGNMQQYTAAWLLRAKTGAHDFAESGHVWDEEKDFNGLLETIFDTNPACKKGTGREGTPWGHLLVRHEAQHDYRNQRNGRLFLDPGDKGAPIGVGLIYKSGIYADRSVANLDTELGKENCEWRPYHSTPQFFNESSPYDGPGPAGPVAPSGLFLLGGEAPGDTDPPDGPLNPETTTWSAPPAPGGGTGVCMGLNWSNNPPNAGVLRAPTGIGYFALATDGSGNPVIYVSTTAGAWIPFVGGGAGQIAFKVTSGPGPVCSGVQVDDFTGVSVSGGIETTLLVERTGSTNIGTGQMVYAQRAPSGDSGDELCYTFVLPLGVCS